MPPVADHDVKERIDAIASGFEEFKKTNDAALKELKAKGSVDPLLSEKIDKMNLALLDAATKRDELAKEIESVKTALSRPGDKETKDQKAAEKALAQKLAFDRYLRKGVVSPDEMKDMSDDSQPDGGYLVRPEISARIIEKVYETSPMRQIATTVSIGSDAVEMAVDLDQAGANWVAERATRSSTASPKLKWNRIPVNELYAEPVATQKQLDDAMWDVEAWLSKKVADRIARLENTAFITGTGVGQPRGVMTYADDTSQPNDANVPYGVIEQIATGNANLLTADGLLNLFYALKEVYQKGASWIMQRNTVLQVRLLKDGFGRYLWEPSLTAGAPDMLMGRPVYQFADVAAVAAGNLPIAVGDFKEAYQVVDRIGIRVLRDPFTSKPNVLFYTTKRTGGDVVNFEAVKIQIVQAAAI